jgi:hypothetical protein
MYRNTYTKSVMDFKYRVQLVQQMPGIDGFHFQLRFIGSSISGCCFVASGCGGFTTIVAETRLLNSV